MPLFMELNFTRFLVLVPLIPSFDAVEKLRRELGRTEQKRSTLYYVCLRKMKTHHHGFIRVF